MFPNLQPLDILLSWKEPSHTLTGILNRFFHAELVRKGRKRYPLASMAQLRKDHARIIHHSSFPGTLYPQPQGFEFTMPAARHFALTREMQAWTNYWSVYRPNLDVLWPDHPDSVSISEMVWDATLKFDGTLYDMGELIGFKWPWLHKLDFGSKNRVCSTGARLILQRVIGCDVFPGIPLNKTLPCDFACSSNFTLIFGREDGDIQSTMKVREGSKSIIQTKGQD